MDGNDIHTGKEGVKWLREALHLYFLVMLGEHEVMVSVIPWWVLWFIVSDRISILHLCPRPETFMQANKDRLHKWLVGVVLKKFGKLLNVDIACDFEEFRVVMNHFSGSFIIKFKQRRTREWI